ncbi:MAG: calcium/sodium antiporter, partial [Prolixibacteraceae bacterium]|nr:calcium/sodium antiporter [Prolixibacteraceae bacterium]
MDTSFFLNAGLLILGIALLVVSGNYLIKGGVGLASYFKLSSLVIGLTVVAFGTSAPELIVSLDAAITGHPEIALGNVIGSNIANIALVLAFTVIIMPMPVASQTIKRSWPWMLISGIALYLAMSNGEIVQMEGVVMVALLVVFILGAIRNSKKSPFVAENIKAPKCSLWVCILMVVLASAGLAFGSRILVESASSIALRMGISERIISITVVAFGTSIPELTASIIAAAKKETDISVGNIIGSNVFNVFAVIGITSTIKPIQDFSVSGFRVDLHFMLAFFLLLFVFILPQRKLLRKDPTGQSTFFSRFKSVEGGWISRGEG